MLDPDNSHEFTIPATPLPQACSTATKKKLDDLETGIFANPEPQADHEDSLSFHQGYAEVLEMRRKLSHYNDPTSELSETTKIPDFTKSTSLCFLPVKDTKDIVEESAFSKVLSISDLDRDEIHCKENWTYLPSKEFNLSVTGVDNSKINPPNFMPADDTLFKDLKSSLMDSLSVNPILKKDLQLSFDTETAAEQKTQVREELEQNLSYPSIKDISLALRGCDLSANPLHFVNEVLKAGTIHNIRTSKTSEFQSNPTEFHSQRLRPALVKEPSEQFIPVQTLEDTLFWGSVDVGTDQTRLVHILNTVPSVQYCITVEGCSYFQILEQTTLKKYKENGKASVSGIGVYEFSISFHPQSVGPAFGILKIKSSHHSKEKLISLNGYGGKSHLGMSKLEWNFSRDDRNVLISTSDLHVKCYLKNTGSATAFFYLSLGSMEEYFIIEKPCGLLNPGEEEEVKICVNQKRHILTNLLSFFDESLPEIGMLSIHYGEEATRQRIKRLYQRYGKFELVRWIEDKFKYLLYDYPGKSSVNLDHIADLPESLTLLLYDGTHRKEVPVKVMKSCIYDCFSMQNKYIVSESSFSLSLQRKSLNFD